MAKRKPKTDDVDMIRPPRAGQSLKTYADFLLGLQSFDGLFDRKSWRVNWLQGKALIEVRKQIKECGGWKRFCQEIGMNESTAKQRRAVADAVTEKESHTLGYAEMLRRVYPSYRKQLTEDADKDWTKPKTKRGKGGLHLVNKDAMCLSWNGSGLSARQPTAP